MLSYILQMIACSGILYGYYHFFLRNEKFHQYNRFYLLLSMVLSLVLPLIKIPLLPAPADNNSSIVYAFVSTGENVSVSNHSNGMNDYLLYALYVIPALLLLIRFITSIRRIIRLKQESSSENFNNITLIYTAHQDAPFSFFSWLFWNKNNNRESADGRQIWQHELYHIRSKHTWDLVFLEIVLSVFWFNPFFYLYRKEIKTIQEFLADQHAIINNNPTNYAELLVLNAMGVRHQKIVSPFFQHQIKRRITMLMSTQKASLQWLRKITAVPLLLATAATIIVSCQQDKESEATTSTENTVSAEQEKKAPTTLSDSSVGQQSITPSSQKAMPVFKNEKGEVIQGPEVFTKVDVEAKYHGNWRSFLERNLDGQVLADNGAPPGNYTVIIQFIVGKNGDVSDVKALTNLGYGAEAEAIRVIKASEKWEPAKQSGRDVKAYRKQPITFQVTEA